MYSFQALYFPGNVSILNSERGHGSSLEVDIYHRVIYKLQKANGNNYNPAVKMITRRKPDQ